jgi:hypothetical protein
VGADTLPEWFGAVQNKMAHKAATAAPYNGWGAAALIAYQFFSRNLWPH